MRTAFAQKEVVSGCISQRYSKKIRMKRSELPAKGTLIGQVLPL